MCEDMGAEYTSLLYYCHSRWLSRGGVLSRTFQLRQEIYAFLEEEKHEYAKHFVETDFLIKLAYLCDIFEKLNSLNLSLQGRNMHILKQTEKISAFRKKLQLWKIKINKECISDCFPLLHQFVTSNETNLSCNIKSIFVDHLSELIKKFEKYFEADIDKFTWIQDPFRAKTPSEFTSLEEESLIDLSCDNTLKLKFGSMELSDFWISVKEEYPLLSGKALRILIPFATSYLCEAGFSAVAVIKSKYRSKINVEQEMRVAISNFIPRFEKLCSEHQAHPSH
ncbi:zinc finger BED domain-containing protein 5-like [Centruroides vittatus]